MQKTILLIMAMFSSLFVAAEEERDAVRLWRHDGSNEVFLLSAKPKVTFTEQELVLTTADITLSYPLSSCEKFTFEKYKDNPQAAGSAVSQQVVFWLTGSGFAASGLEPDSPVTVYDVQGRPVLNARADDNGSLEAEGFAGPGVYIVKTKNSTFKMIRK